MGLAARVIPTLLCRGRQLVKGQQFNAWRSVGLAAQAVRIHQARGVDELVLLDITATAEGRGPDLELVEELSDVLFCPLAVGGGVRSVEDVKALLRAGADKVVIGAAAVQVRGLVSEVSTTVGSQALVVAIDVHYGAPVISAGVDGGTMVFSHDPASEPMNAVYYARRIAALGAGEILLTAVERDGTMQGYDLDLIRSVSRAVTIPVIAHGGCGTYEHMREAIEAGASAVAAGAMFQFTDQTPKGAAQYLAQHGVEARV